MQPRAVIHFPDAEAGESAALAAYCDASDSSAAEAGFLLLILQRTDLNEAHREAYERYDALLSVRPAEHGLIFQLLVQRQYDFRVVRAIVFFLENSLSLSPETVLNISAGLQEGLMNALVQGALELSSHYSTVEEFERHYDAITARLQQLRYQGRIITVHGSWDTTHLQLTVSHALEGEDNAGQPTRLPHGRGLAIIHACSDSVQFTEDFRSVTMRYALQAVQAKSFQQEERLHRSLILLVDDIEFNRYILSNMLRERGFCHFIEAGNGQEAVERARLHKPDLIILDLLMPVMNGFDCCEQLRTMPECRDTPILIQTALTDPEERARAFRVGASDFITKPINPEELCARAKVHLEKAMMLTDLRRYKERTETELHSARDMQNSLLPSKEKLAAIEARYGMEIHQHFEPSFSIGGDFWGAHELTSTELGLYMVDFSGHGVTAALHAFRVHTILHELQPLLREPDSLLGAMNERLHVLLPRHQYATMFYGVLDIARSELRYATAAAPSTLVVRASGEITSLSGRGFPLGVIANAPYETHTTPFAPQDMLMLYSDALIETDDMYQKRWGEETLHNLLGEVVEQHPANESRLNRSFDYIMNKFRRHQGASPLEDDLTVMMLQRR